MITLASLEARTSLAMQSENALNYTTLITQEMLKRAYLTATSATHSWHIPLM